VLKLNQGFNANILVRKTANSYCVTKSDLFYATIILNAVSFIYVPFSLLDRRFLSIYSPLYTPLFNFVPWYLARSSEKWCPYLDLTDLNIILIVTKMVINTWIVRWTYLFFLYIFSMYRKIVCAYQIILQIHYLNSIQWSIRHIL
jgi:hypothetical protein